MKKLALLLLLCAVAQAQTYKIPREDTGLDSAKPATCTVPQHYVATDTHKFYFCDVTNHLSEGGFALDASNFTGADIFAKANAAATVAGSPGLVIIPPGTYNSVTTTLNCVSNVNFEMAGVAINYTGSTKGLNVANVQGCNISGYPKITGPDSAGSTVGVQLGIGSSGSGTITQNNVITAYIAGGFGIGFKGEGSSGNNGTYSNSISLAAVNSNGINIKLVPTTPSYFNANDFTVPDCEGATVACLVADGITGNHFIGKFRVENNPGIGMSFPGAQATYGNTWDSLWLEGNGTDWSIGSATNVYRNRFYSIVGSSPLTNQGGALNEFFGPTSDDSYGGPFLWHLNAQTGAAFGWAVVNDEASGNPLDVLGVSRTGINTGNVYIGTPDYLPTLRGNLQMNGFSISNGSPLSVPATGASLISDTATQTLSGKTLTAPIINGGSINPVTLLLNATAPTISSGFGTSPAIVASNGTAAFQVNVGTGGTATNGVIGLPTAANGWSCTFADVTTQSTTVFLSKQIASTTTTVTVANYNTAGAQAAWVASDKLNASCLAY